MGLLSGIGNIVGELTGTNAAADAAMSANRAAMGLTKDMWDEQLGFQTDIWNYQKKQSAPWITAGLAGLGQFTDELNAGFNFEEDPGYQFRLAEGERGIERAASSRGRSLSGATLRELGRYNSGLASQEYGAAHGRYQDRLSRLKSLADFGMTASTGINATGSQFSSSVGAGYQSTSQNLAQGYQNQGAIQAQAATAPFQNLMAIGQTGASVMGGMGLMGFTPFAG